jgi:hypothetical protein
MLVTAATSAGAHGKKHPTLEPEQGALVVLRPPVLASKGVSHEDSELVFTVTSGTDCAMGFPSGRGCECGRQEAWPQSGGDLDVNFSVSPLCLWQNCRGAKRDIKASVPPGYSSKFPFHCSCFLHHSRDLLLKGRRDGKGPGCASRR